MSYGMFATPLGRCRGYNLHKKIIYGHPPLWHRRLRLGHLPTPVERRMVRVAGTIYTNHIGAEQVYIPYDQRATGEVVGAFCLHVPLGCRTVVILTTYLHS